MRFFFGLFSLYLRRWATCFASRDLMRLRLIEYGPGIKASGSASLSGRSLGMKRGSSIMAAESMQEKGMVTLDFIIWIQSPFVMD